MFISDYSMLMSSLQITGGRQAGRVRYAMENLLTVLKDRIHRLLLVSFEDLVEDLR